MSKTNIRAWLIPAIYVTTWSRGQLKCDGTAQNPDLFFRAKRTSPFKSAGIVSSVDYWPASAVVMLDTPCSEVVWRVLATHSNRQFPLQFPDRASSCAITFQLESTVNLQRRAMLLPYLTKLRTQSNGNVTDHRRLRNLTWWWNQHYLP